MLEGVTRTSVGWAKAGFHWGLLCRGAERLLVAVTRPSVGMLGKVDNGSGYLGSETGG